MAGRADDVAEDDGQQVACDRARAPTGEELLDLAEHVRAVDRAREVVDALELDVARARDASGQVARIAHVDQAVAGAVQDERRDAQLAEQVGDVVIAGGVHEPQQLARAQGQALHARQPGLHARVVGRGGRSARGWRPCPTPRRAAPTSPGARRRRRSIHVRVGQRAGHRGVEDDGLHTLGRHRGGGDGEQSAGRVAHEHRALAARGVEDGEHVAGLVFEGHGLAARIGEAAAATVHDQQPREAHQALEEARQPRLLPQVLDVEMKPGTKSRSFGASPAAVHAMITSPFGHRASRSAPRAEAYGCMRGRPAALPGGELDARIGSRRRPSVTAPARGPLPRARGAAVSRPLGDRLRAGPQPGGRGSMKRAGTPLVAAAAVAVACSSGLLRRPAPIR